MSTQCVKTILLTFILCILKWQWGKGSYLEFIAGIYNFISYFDIKLGCSVSFDTKLGCSVTQNFQK